MKTYKIKYGPEMMEMDENGLISRPAIGMKASGDWAVVGAVRINNFGHVVEHVSLGEIKEGKLESWQHKNGKQKWFVRDYDHGTFRTWMSPNHSIIV